MELDEHSQSIHLKICAPYTYFRTSLSFLFASGVLGNLHMQVFSQTVKCGKVLFSNRMIRLMVVV